MTKPIRPRRGKVILTIVIILAVAIITMLVFRGIYNNNDQPTTSGDGGSSSTTSDNSTSSEPATSTDSQTSASDSDTPATDTPVQYEGADPNTSATIEATLTYYGMQNGEYIVNINISQYLSGSCQITLGTYSGTVTIDQGAANSACSFHIPPAQLSSGLTQLKVNIKSGTASGAVEETIDVSL